MLRRFRISEPVPANPGQDQHGVGTTDLITQALTALAVSIESERRGRWTSSAAAGEGKKRGELSTPTPSFRSFPELLKIPSGIESISKSDVLPSDPCKRGSDCGIGHAKQSYEVFDRGVSANMESAHLANGIGGEFGLREGFPARLFSSALHRFVGHVVESGPRKKMPWVTAGRVVAGMADERPVRRNGIVLNEVGNPVGLEHFAGDIHASIALFEFSSQPKPAIIGAPNVNLGPEQPNKAEVALYWRKRVSYWIGSIRHGVFMLDVRAIAELVASRWLAFFKPESAAKQTAFA